MMFISCTAKQVSLLCTWKLRRNGENFLSHNAARWLLISHVIVLNGRTSMREQIFITVFNAMNLAQFIVLTLITRRQPFLISWRYTIFIIYKLKYRKPERWKKMPRWVLRAGEKGIDYHASKDNRPLSFRATDMYMVLTRKKDRIAGDGLCDELICHFPELTGKCIPWSRSESSWKNKTNISFTPQPTDVASRSIDISAFTIPSSVL